ncbi:YqcC family protein [Oceanimonas sp. CHS3-5]|uniref:YqcC family protein n=1 Tax=Oceanimonas sp. CHS3-5 TaxID=3068186 RepID=UPI00273D14EF|nr:YqcC family protein [Oceanimonas sp. CHS3-5]MDP5290782.1 YqcC family protein [Oceanimonas sp. CHS3-5]
MSADIQRLLLDIERELTALGWWQETPPSAEALASTQPFCIDTLSLAQWLQFILLPRLRAMLTAGTPLPSRIAVYPVAVESFRRESGDPGALLEAIACLDEALSGQPVVREA